MSGSNQLRITTDAFVIGSVPSNQAGFIVGNNSAGVAISNYANAAGEIQATSYTGVNIPLLIQRQAGNVLIGTTTDAGFKLDVNGTARVSGQFDVISGTANFRVNNNSTYVQLGIGSTAWATYNSVETYYGGSQFFFQAGANFRFAGVGQFGFTGNPSNSAILQADSTTRGFLPPRMTNAQRTAIVSPAVGLIVYCTDVTEGLWVFKSTGWTFIV